MGLQTISTILTTVSLVFIAWYTFEAYRTRKNSLIPILVIYLRKADEYHSDWRIWIRNIGNGPACNIKVKPIGRKDGIVRFIFNENYLIPGEEEELRFQLRDKKDHSIGKEMKNFFLCPLFDEYFEVDLVYRDIERKVVTSELTHLNDHKIILKRIHKIPPFLQKS